MRGNSLRSGSLSSPEVCRFRTKFLRVGTHSVKGRTYRGASCSFLLRSVREPRRQYWAIVGLAPTYHPPIRGQVMLAVGVFAIGGTV